MSADSLRSWTFVCTYLTWVRYEDKPRHLVLTCGKALIVTHGCCHARPIYLYFPYYCVINPRKFLMTFETCSAETKNVICSLYLSTSSLLCILCALSRVNPLLHFLLAINPKEDDNIWRSNLKRCWQAFFHKNLDSYHS
jgi:hypothetical protein